MRTQHRVLSQVSSPPTSSRDRKVMAIARKRVARLKEFSRSLRGLTCQFCGSRKTKTEFYRFPGDRTPRFGVTACNTCGAS